MISTSFIVTSPNSRNCGTLHGCCNISGSILSIASLSMPIEQISYPWTESILLLSYVPLENCHKFPLAYFYSVRFSYIGYAFYIDLNMITL
jgi:hypothetical protein